MLAQDKSDSVAHTLCVEIQGSAKRLRPGLVNFVTAVAYHLCLVLPAGFTQPGQSLLADPCTSLFDYSSVICYAISLCMGTAFS